MSFSVQHITHTPTHAPKTEKEKLWKISRASLLHSAWYVLPLTRCLMISEQTYRSTSRLIPRYSLASVRPQLPSPLRESQSLVWTGKHDISFLSTGIVKRLLWSRQNLDRTRGPSYSGPMRTVHFCSTKLMQRKHDGKKKKKNRQRTGPRINNDGRFEI